MNQIARAGVVLCIALAVVLGAVYLVRALSDFGDAASNNSSLSFSDREVAGGNGIVADQQAVYEAQGIIPRNARYRVVTGSLPKNATSLTLPFIESWYRYFLMPRRTAADARWIICYGCDVSKLGGAYVIAWQDDQGISIGRLQ
ncbi:MAG TPA: hypothetical protein VIU81_03670 [Gaiellaceae bacterium]